MRNIVVILLVMNFNYLLSQKIDFNKSILGNDKSIYLSKISNFLILQKIQNINSSEQASFRLITKYSLSNKYLVIEIGDNRQNYYIIDSNNIDLKGRIRSIEDLICIASFSKYIYSYNQNYSCSIDEFGNLIYHNENYGGYFRSTNCTEESYEEVNNYCAHIEEFEGDIIEDNTKYYNFLDYSFLLERSMPKLGLEYLFDKRSYLPLNLFFYDQKLDNYLENKFSLNIIDLRLLFSHQNKDGKFIVYCLLDKTENNFSGHTLIKIILEDKYNFSIIGEVSLLNNEISHSTFKLEDNILNEL